MSRARMTMRAVIERDAAVGSDSWGGDVAPNFQPHATLPCFVWSNQSRLAADGDKSVLLEDMRAMFPLNADVAEGDEIASVTDRRGVEIIPGRLRIDAKPQRKHRHIEAALLRVA